MLHPHIASHCIRRVSIWFDNKVPIILLDRNRPLTRILLSPNLKISAICCPCEGFIFSVTPIPCHVDFSLLDLSYRSQSGLLYVFFRK